MARNIENNHQLWSTNPTQLTVAEAHQTNNCIIDVSTLRFQLRLAAFVEASVNQQGDTVIFTTYSGVFCSIRNS